MSSAIKQPEAKIETPRTSFYVVAETVCPACEGKCREQRRSRWGEPDFCANCGGHGVTANRIDLRDALSQLGVELPTVNLER